MDRFEINMVRLPDTHWQAIAGRSPIPRAMKDKHKPRRVKAAPKRCVLMSPFALTRSVKCRSMVGAGEVFQWDVARCGVFGVMTFNIRFETEEDRENTWESRRDLVVELMTRHAPRVLGTQEGMWHQLKYLQGHLPGYTLLSPFRVIDESCQYPSIFYRTAEFEFQEGGEFWLSKTPAVHRSKDWDSAFPRMMSYGRFMDRETKERIWCIVTHLDHQGTEARRCQGEMIADFVRRRRGPVILMGDFNDRPGSAVHGILTGPDTGLCDTWQVLGREEDEMSMTHHGFRGTPQKTRMDWILVSTHFRVVEARIIRDNRHGRYPSDHFPYAVDLELG